jgi:hypothetical protein
LCSESCGKVWVGSSSEIGRILRIKINLGYDVCGATIIIILLATSRDQFHVFLTYTWVELMMKRERTKRDN